MKRCEEQMQAQQATHAARERDLQGDIDRLRRQLREWRCAPLNAPERVAGPANTLVTCRFERLIVFFLASMPPLRNELRPKWEEKDRQ